MKINDERRRVVTVAPLLNNPSLAATPAPRLTEPTPADSWRALLRVVLLSLIGGWLLSSAAPRPAAAQQHLAERYLEARLRLKVNQLLEQRDGVLLPPLPATRLPVAADSLRPDPDPPSPDPSAIPSGLQITERRAVRKLERSWFRSRFGDTKWAFLGAGYYFTPLDTMQTRELRARLEAHFGPPTQTLADYKPAHRPKDLVQFEYWLVANDSIPVIVTDVNGPTDRGIIVSTDQRYRDCLQELRQAVLKPIVESDTLAPYVDYYYDRVSDAWYRTGFDGAHYFLDRVRRRDVTPGRRPWLERRSRRNNLRR